MKTKIEIGGKSYNVEVSEIKEDLLRVRVDDKDYFFTKNESGLRLTHPSEAKELGKESEVIWETLAEKEIKSPIAGTVSSIDVKKDQTLKPGQKVATLISMKMENEIISEGYGKIKEVKVKENQFVNSGDILITLE